MSDLEQFLKDLPKLLREREAALEEREQRILRLQEDLEKKHPNLGKPSDVLGLNIGGKRINVLRRTLSQVEGSLLESMFSGRWDESLEKDTDGNYFIDQDEALFIPLLNYLRAKQNETPVCKRTTAPSFGGNIKHDFQAMCEYYGLTHFVFPTGIHKFDFELYKTKSIQSWNLKQDCQEGIQIVAKELETYWLKPITNCHSRKVSAFEIVLGESCTAAQIGWFNEFAGISGYIENSDQGCGYGQGSMALDCFRCGIACNSMFELLGSGTVSLKEGSVILTDRREKDGVKWYVDGNLVATKLLQDCSDRSGPRDMRTDGLPCISINGSFTIAKIELEF